MSRRNNFPFFRIYATITSVLTVFRSDTAVTTARTGQPSFTQSAKSATNSNHRNKLIRLVSSGQNSKNIPFFPAVVFLGRFAQIRLILLDVKVADLI